MDSIARTPSQIGAILQRQRRLKQLSQAVLAGLSGTGQKTISKIETGNPATKVDTLLGLLAVLDLELVIAPRSKGPPIEDIF